MNKQKPINEAAKKLISFLAEDTKNGLVLYSEFDRYSSTSKKLLQLISNLKKEIDADESAATATFNR